MADYPYDNQFTPNDLYRFYDNEIEYSVDIDYSNVDYETIGIENVDANGIKTYNMDSLSELVSDLKLVNQAYAELLNSGISVPTTIVCNCRCADYPNCVQECKQGSTETDTELELLRDLIISMNNAISNFECTCRNYAYNIDGYHSYRNTIIDNEQVCRILEMP